MSIYLASWRFICHILVTEDMARRSHARGKHYGKRKNFSTERIRNICVYRFRICDGISSPRLSRRQHLWVTLWHLTRSGQEKKMAFCVWLLILMLASGYRCFSACQGPIPRMKDPKCESQRCFSIEDPAGRGLVEASCWPGNGTEALFRPGAGVEHLHLKMEMRKEECESEVRFVRYNVSLAEVEKGAWHQFVLDFVEIWQHHLYLHFHVTLDGRKVALVNSGYYKHSWRYNGYSVWVNGSVQYGPGCVTEKPKENRTTARLHLHETTLTLARQPSTRQTEDESPATQQPAHAAAAQQSPVSLRAFLIPTVALVILFSALLIAFLMKIKRKRMVTLRSRAVTIGVSSLFQRRGPNDPYPAMLARE